MTRVYAACGTDSGYQRHRRLNEEPCTECRKAKAAYQADYRSRADNKARNKAFGRARDRALVRLRELHLDEYDALYVEEINKEGLW